MLDETKLLKDLSNQFYCKSQQQSRSARKDNIKVLVVSSRVRNYQVLKGMALPYHGNEEDFNSLLPCPATGQSSYRYCTRCLAVA